MNSLPELAGGPIRYRLPLAEESAIRLIDVLLAESAGQRAERLATALICDAPLAVWALLTAPEPVDAAAPLPALVAWLEPRIARFLAQPALLAQDLGRDVAGNFQQTVSPGGARRSAAPAANPAKFDGTLSADDQNRQFIVLAMGAVDWLIRYGTPTPDRQQAIQALPAWLAEVLDDLPSSIASGSREPTATPNTAPAGELDWAGRLSRVASRVARLTELEDNFQRAVETEKLAALKEFAYGAGHEINNPLANISARAQTLLKDESDPERRQKLAAINTQALRAHEMISDLMLFAHPPQWKSQRVPLGPLLAELAVAWQRQAAEQRTELVVRVADDALAVWADRAALAVALRALVANALEALSRGGSVEVAVTPARLCDDDAAEVAPSGAVQTGAGANGESAARQSPNLAPPADAVAIRVCDDGPGIDAALRPRIFDPFFSGREAGRGLGFGLSKCWRIATAMGGRIEVASGSVAGATFTLVLPMPPA